MADENIIIPIPSGSMGGVPMPQRSDRADLVDKLNPAVIIDTCRHMLLGETWNGSEWKKIVFKDNYGKSEDNSLTELGAWKIANELMGIATISTVTSKYKEEMIKARLRRMAINVQIQLIGNWRKYGIKSTSQLHSVHNLIFSISMAVLFQAGDGSIQELLKGTVQENRNINTEKKEPGKLRRMIGLA